MHLDFYEGCPGFYYKKDMKVTLTETGEEVDAFVYIMHEERELGIPSERYVHGCKQGYEDFGFDCKYLEQALIDTIGGMEKWAKQQLQEQYGYAPSAEESTPDTRHFPGLTIQRRYAPIAERERHLKALGSA